MLKIALKEDIGKGDITSEVLIPKKAKGRAEIIARDPGIFCGVSVVKALCRILDRSLQVKYFVQDGKHFSKNQKVIGFKGHVRSILALERTILNFIGWLCSISTQTRKFVDRVKGYPVIILDTRKTTPRWRDFEKYAVRCGGGCNHRMGLYAGIFIKENHRKHGKFANLKKYEGQFEIEVRNMKELKEALTLSPGVILFDNFEPSALIKGVELARKTNPDVILEASGGITLENVAHYAAEGVNWISVGSLTHSVRSHDFSLLIS